MATNVFLLSLGVLISLIISVLSHGRLLEPPSRSSMWRCGYSTPKNYNDHELFCGGIKTFKITRASAGFVGMLIIWALVLMNLKENMQLESSCETTFLDKYLVYNIFQNEITVGVELTANHNGFFEFRICRSTSKEDEVTQQCLDRNVLTITDTGSSQYYVGKDGASYIELKLRLPPRLTCEHCVLQWTYTAGNNSGGCSAGNPSCIANEIYRACADVSISNRNVNNRRRNPNLSCKNQKKNKGHAHVGHQIKNANRPIKIFQEVIDR